MHARLGAEPCSQRQAQMSGTGCMCSGMGRDPANAAHLGLLEGREMSYLPETHHNEPFVVHLLCVRGYAGFFSYVISFNQIILQSKYFYSHFTREVTEAQKVRIIS